MDNLPMDIIENIGKCLNTNTDVSVFRAVCKSWRSSIPASQIKSPIRVCIEYKGKKVLNLIESVVRESDQENRVFRVHPLSSLPCPPALNWLDFKVLELGKSLGDSNFRLFRAAISSNPDWPAVMVVAYSNLYYCKLGAGACKHVEIEKCNLVNKDGISELHCWRDVVFYKGVFYAVSLDDTTIAIDSSLEIKLVKSSPGSPVVENRNLPGVCIWWNHWGSYY
ncbi:hypothetical protein ACLB2K_000896 [Fragaria x ananassa]